MKLHEHLAIFKFYNFLFITVIWMEQLSSHVYILIIVIISSLLFRSVIRNWIRNGIGMNWNVKFTLSLGESDIREIEFVRRNLLAQNLCWIASKTGDTKRNVRSCWDSDRLLPISTKLGKDAGKRRPSAFSHEGKSFFGNRSRGRRIVPRYKLSECRYQREVFRWIALLLDTFVFFIEEFVVILISFFFSPLSRKEISFSRDSLTFDESRCFLSTNFYFSL